MDGSVIHSREMNEEKVCGLTPMNEQCSTIAVRWHERKSPAFSGG